MLSLCSQKVTIIANFRRVKTFFFVLSLSLMKCRIFTRSQWVCTQIPPNYLGDQHPPEQNFLNFYLGTLLSLFFSLSMFYTDKISFKFAKIMEIHTIWPFVMQIRPWVLSKQNYQEHHHRRKIHFMNQSHTGFKPQLY